MGNTKRRSIIASSWERGQGLAEFALVTPLLLFVTLGIVDFGRAFFTYAQLSFQLREALRWGSLAQEGPTIAYTQCVTMRDIAKRSFFSYDQKVTIRFEHYDAPGTYWWCWDELGIATGPVGAPQPNDIKQFDMLQIISDQKVRLISPFFPQELSFRMEGQRTIIKQMTLGHGSNDLDSDGLLDTWECSNFGNRSCTDVGKLPGCGLPLDAAVYSNCLTPDYDSEAAKPARQAFDAFSDPDHDGCNNGCEELYTSDPWDPDTDDDGLTDGDEDRIWSSLPTNVDTDGDGLWDGDETTGCTAICLNSDPDILAAYALNHWDSRPGTTQSDADGVDDYEELVTWQTDPMSAAIQAPVLTLDGTNCTASPASMRLVWDDLSLLDPTNKVDGYDIFVNGTQVGRIDIPLGDPATTECITLNGDPNSCFTLGTFSWSPYIDYHYEVRGTFGTLQGEMGAADSRCQPIPTVQNVLPGATVDPTCNDTIAPYSGLKWDQVAGLNGYYIYATSSSDPLFQNVRIGEFLDDTILSCGPDPLGVNCWNLNDPVTGLPYVMDPNQQYTYTVAAVLLPEYGPPSNPVTMACIVP